MFLFYSDQLVLQSLWVHSKSMRLHAGKGRWDRLTFDTKSEILIIVERIAIVPATSTLFSPSYAFIHLSF